MQSEYDRIHEWLCYHFSKKKICDICKTKVAKKYEFALKKKYKYRKNRNNFFELCSSCHRRYDMTKNHKKKTSITMKRILTEKDRIRLKTMNIGRKQSREQKEKARERMIINNPMKNKKTKEKVSNSIKKLYKLGIYKK